MGFFSECKEYLEESARNFFDWLKAWDKYRTILLALIGDMLQAEIQVLCFFTFYLWDIRDLFITEEGTYKFTQSGGFQMYPSYICVRTYFVCIGALCTRIFVTWLLMEGITTGVSSHVRAGIIGTTCTTIYIVIGGYVLYVHQYLHFGLAWWILALFILGFTAYGVISGVILWMVWTEIEEGTLRIHSKNIGQSILVICGVFMGFIQLKLIIIYNAETRELKGTQEQTLHLRHLQAQTEKEPQWERESIIA